MLNFRHMTPEEHSWYAEITIAILIIVLVVLSMFLVQQYRTALRQGEISAERLQFANLVRHHSLGAVDVSLIAPWMTFNYVSVSFKVPISYLMTALGVPGAAADYPNETIGHYAKTIATSTSDFLTSVRSAVRSYLLPAPASTAPASPAPQIPQAE